MRYLKSVIHLTHQSVDDRYTETTVKKMWVFTIMGK